MSHTYLESHGVRLDVEVQDDALIPAVRRILPPGWQPLDDFPEDGHFTLSPGSDGRYDVFFDGSPLGTDLAVDVAVHVLDAQLRAHVAFLAPDRIFIHAGVVALGDRALVLPGPSFSGKTALVASLVAAGATYYSDEYAVLDEQGFIHPYARPLSLRGDTGRYGEYTDVESLGGTAGRTPVRASAIAVTRYVPGDRWTPDRRDTGVGALALLTNAVAARTRTAQTVAAVGRAAAGAEVLEGSRGEADETSELLMRTLCSSRS